MIDYKAVPPDEMASWFDGLVEFKKKPFHHQLVSIAFALGENQNKVMFMHGIGTGKTLSALYLLQCWNPNGKTLVVCPASIMEDTWMKEIKVSTTFKASVLSGTANQRIEKLRKRKDIYIINYEGLRTIYGTKTVSRRGNKSTKYIVNPERVAQYPFEAVIFDECHNLMNPDALQCRIAGEITKRARYCIGLTGTPMARDLPDLFGEYLVIDGGGTLGTSFNQFINQYYIFNPFTGEYRPKRVCGICGQLYTNKAEHVGEHGWKLFDYLKKYPHELTGEDLLLKRISKNTIRYSREECVDLPEKIYEHRFVHPTPEQSTILNGLSSDMNFELKDGIEIQSHAQKLLQVTSGFLMKEGEVVWEAEKNPKAVELESIIKQMEGKFIIYHIYVHESEIIQSILDKHKIEHVVLNGKVPKNVRDKRLGLFQSNDNCRVMVAHPETGGVGLNLQFCNTIIYYSNGYIGHILREQSEGRTNRTGQTRNCVYIDLIMRGTLDEVLYESLMNKGDSIRATLNFIKNIHSKKT